MKKTQKVKLTKTEQKIYDSVMDNFPATKHEHALAVALEGGVNYQFQSK